MLVVLLCSSTAACEGHVGAGEPGLQADAPWGARAIAWWEAMGQAAAEGAEHMVSFLAPDLVWEDRIVGEVTHDEDEWIAAQLRRYDGPFPWTGGSVLVSADGALAWFDAPLPNGIGEPFLDRMVIGPDGIDHWVTAATFGSCRVFEPWRCELDAEGLVDRYLALWNGSSSDIGSVYAPEATIEDTLLGASRSGADAIALPRTSDAWPFVGRLTVMSLPEGRRAVFWAPTGPDGEGPEEIRFLAEADDGSGCPGLMGVAMALEGDLVIWERRYHDVAAIRRCYEPSRLTSGWWDRFETPDTMVIEKTGTVVYGTLDVDVYNGTPPLDGFVSWGFSRFEAAGLPIPRTVESLTFLRARTTCRNVAGLAAMESTETNIVLCATADDICTGDGCRRWSVKGRRAWLHELAHAWLREHVDGSTRAAFLERTGLPRWFDDGPWRQRGVERAAETISFGLMDEPVVLVPGLHGDCETRDDGFRILTGTNPVAPCTTAPDDTSS